MLRRRPTSAAEGRRVSMSSSIRNNVSATSKSLMSQAWWKATRILSDSLRPCRGTVPELSRVTLSSNRATSVHLRQHRATESQQPQLS